MLVEVWGAVVWAAEVEPAVGAADMVSEREEGEEVLSKGFY